MVLTDKHLEAIRAAALTVEFGSVTIKAGTDNSIDIIVENRLRIPKGRRKQTPGGLYLPGTRTNRTNAIEGLTAWVSKARGNA